MPEKALEFIRKLQEEAWDEGYHACETSRVGKKKKNPYRKKEKK